MIDTLDLPLLAEHNKKLKRTRQSRLRAQSFTVLIIIIMFGSIFLSGVLSINSIYQVTEDWKQMSGLLDRARDIQVSASGVIWILTDYGLSRLDGTTWTHYNRDDFGTTDSRLRGGDFAVYGESVWAASNEGIVHFDGENWTLHRDVLLSTDSDVSISAGDLGVYALDCEGYLTYIDIETGAWRADYLPEDLGRELRQQAAYCYPRVMQMPDDTVWIEWHGLWRLDQRGDWDYIRLDRARTDNVRLVGVEKDHAWTWWGRSGLVSIDLDLTEWEIYEPDVLGLSDNAIIYEHAADDDTEWFATSEGVLRLEDDTWVLMKGSVVSTFSEVAVSPDGNLWVISSESTSYLILTLIAITGMLIVLLISLFILLRLFFKEQQLSAEFNGRGYEILSRILPELPKKQTSTLGLLSVFGLIVLVVVLLVTAIRLPLMLMVPYILTALLLLMSIVQIFSWWNSSTTKPGLLQTLIYAIPNILAIIWAAVVSLAGTRLFALWFGGYNLVAISAVPIALTALMPIFLHSIGIYWWSVHRPVSHGDYETAKRRINMLREYQPDRSIFTLHSMYVLEMAGEFAEAERLARAVIPTVSSNAILLLSAVYNLAYALIGQRRYDEALPFAEAVVWIQPSLSIAYKNIADIYLNQRIEEDRTQKIIDFAVSNYSPNWLQRCMKDNTLVLLYGCGALALARLKKNSQAAETIEHAIAQADHNHKPSLAYLYIYAGYTMLENDLPHAAVQYFKKASQLDPQGYAGQQAAEALR